MVMNQQIEYANGLHAKVVWPGDALYEFLFIIERDGQYAACDGIEEEWCFINEMDPWRDSFTDAMCDIELADEIANRIADGG